MVQLSKKYFSNPRDAAFSKKNFLVIPPSREIGPPIKKFRETTQKIACEAASFVY